MPTRRVASCYVHDLAASCMEGSIPSTKVDPGGGSGGPRSAHRPHERLLPMTFSTPYTPPMPITKATVAAMRPLLRIERRLRGGRRENQPIADLIRLTKLFRKLMALFL